MAYESVIEAGKSQRLYWKDLWHFRELFYFLAWRDVLVRYKQTVIGVAWSVLRPFLTMLALTLVFGKIANLPSEADVPYPIMVYCAMLAWQFFANSFSESSNSLISNTPLISKVYLPRLIIPASSIIVNLVDFFISFLLFGLIMAWYRFIPSWKIVFLPLLLLFASITALGFGLYLCALNVKYRDFRYVIPFIVQFGLFISPVGFSSSVVPDKWRMLYSLNPMVGVIDGFRWAVLGTDTALYLPGFFLSILISCLVFWFGLRYFRNVERSFADFI
jgi:lipopolysaccharide transport system permease protein